MKILSNQWTPKTVRYHVHIFSYLHLPWSLATLAYSSCIICHTVAGEVPISNRCFRRVDPETIAWVFKELPFANHVAFISEHMDTHGLNPTSMLSILFISFHLYRGGKKRWETWDKAMIWDLWKTDVDEQNAQTSPMILTCCPKPTLS